MIRAARLTAAAVGLAVLAWQIWNARNGRFVHAFLVSDVVVAVLLIAASAWPGERPAATLMMAGFAAMAAVFLSATTGRLLVGGEFDPGTVLTAVGLLPCLLGAIGLGRRLIVAGPRQ
jgi:cytochrome bd-type quinol oxidase subunit 1